MRLNQQNVLWSSKDQPEHTHCLINRCYLSEETVKLNLLIACPVKTGLKVIKLEFILQLKIKRNDWLLADTCLQATNHFALF